MTSDNQPSPTQTKMADFTTNKLSQQSPSSSRLNGLSNALHAAAYLFIGAAAVVCPGVSDWLVRTPNDRKLVS